MGSQSAPQAEAADQLVQVKDTFWLIKRIRKFTDHLPYSIQIYRLTVAWRRECANRVCTARRPSAADRPRCADT
jgi:hypothetical protein